VSEGTAGVDADSNRTTGLDRFLEIVPFAASALVVLMIMYWLAARRSTPTIFTDEIEWAQLSRAIAATGHAAQRGEPTSFKSLYAFLIAPGWRLHSTAASYTAIKYMNTTVMATAAIPVYLLARRLVSVRAAGIAAVGALCTSAFFYAPLLLPEVLAYPTFCLCAYASVRALSGDGRRWTVAAIVLSILAVAVRKELACVGASLAIAALVLWLAGPQSKRIRKGWSVSDHIGAAILGIGALVVLNAVFSPHSPEWATVTSNYQGRLWHLAFEAASALTIGLAVLPVVAGLASLWIPERRHDPRWRAFAAFLAASIVTFGTYTGVKAAFLSTVFGTYTEERNLIYLGPLLLVGAVVYFSAKRPSIPALAAATAVVGWLTIGYGYQLGYPYFEAPGYGIAAFANRVFRWDQSTIRIGLWVTLAVSLGFCALPFTRRFRLRPVVLGFAALAAAVWMLTGTVTSGRGSQSGAKALVSHLPTPLNWIDVRAGGAGVTYLGQQIGNDPGLWLTEFWNRSIKHVWTLDGSAPGPGPTLTPDLAAPNGTLSNDPGLDFVVTDNGVDMVGRMLETQGSLSLVRVTHPWKLRETYYGRSSDGWIGNDGTFAYFGPAVPGTLKIDVSRASFCPTGAPPTRVTVRVGPVALNEQRAATVARATTVRHFLLRNCTSVPIELHVTPPVAATVHVASLVRLSDYGISDSRVVGAVIGGSFTPNGMH
jgi:Dolichyl-phosphate-mannose-protein mannosyltransferase